MSLLGSLRCSLNDLWNLVPDDHLLSELLLGNLEALGRVDHVGLEWGVPVVEGLLGWVDGGWEEFEVPFVLSDFLGSGERLEVGFDVGINTKVWNWVVHWMSSWGFWPLVLSASCGRANWVRLSASFGLQHSCSERVLSIGEVGLGNLDIMIELWGEVVVNILGWVFPLSL